MNILNIFKIVSKFNSKYLDGIRQYSQNTIYSLSSGLGKCGVSVIRVSGPNSKSAVTNLIDKNFNPKPRYAYLKSLYHPKNGDMIDKGLVLWFPGPKSFTGEDCCEFQIHGSIAVVNYLMEALSTLPDFRVAKPGEYTKRSFYNGKLDLTEAEGLADLIHSETESQRKQALLQSTGALSKLYGDWRKQIINNVAHMEAYIDFAEDENIEDNVLHKIYSNLTALKQDIKKHLDDHRRGEILRNGVRTAIIGSPNVGKSSFMNLLCQRDISIVTSTAGTTRDIIESSVNIGGYPVVFADTAGLRNKTDDLIEAEGINRAINYIKTSDFVIFLIDAVQLVKFLKLNPNIDEYNKNYLKSLNLDAESLDGKEILNVINKIDLLTKQELEILQKSKDLSCISCKTNENTEKVFSQIKKFLEKLCGKPSVECPHLTKARHRQNLNECVENLEIFLESFRYISAGGERTLILEDYLDIGILAQQLRKAVRNIEEITGAVRTDDILDVIFRDFCIGK